MICFLNAIPAVFARVTKRIFTGLSFVKRWIVAIENEANSPPKSAAQANYL
jgi:hypothetical protein